MAPGLHGCAPADPLPPWPSPGQGPRELGDPQLKPQAWGFSGGLGQWALRPLEQEAGAGEGP